MHFCLRVASDATVIDKGQIVYRDTIAALKENHQVRRRYLAHVSSGRSGISGPLSRRIAVS